MGDVVRIDNARKTFGQIVALDNLSLAIRDGECLAMVGRNGAGKTTTVRALCGRIALDSGSIAWHARRSAHSPMCGLVPQEIALYPLLTGVENLAVFGALNGLRGAALRERIEWALTWTALADRADDPIKLWSVGMKRRLNIACGVLHRPRIALLDEPTAGVDPENRLRIWNMLHALRDSGTSLLLTTHQLHEAETVSDRIAIIDKGAVIACGTLDSLVGDTLGREHRLSLRLAAPLRPGVLDGFEELHAIDERRIAATLHDTAEQLPRLLQTIQRAGGKVESFEVGAPDLEDVFLHLTKAKVDE
jgi:ABC-2 type transport system ATP-binding protein